MTILSWADGIFSPTRSIQCLPVSLRRRGSDFQKWGLKKSCQFLLWTELSDRLALFMNSNNFLCSSLLLSALKWWKYAVYPAESCQQPKTLLTAALRSPLAKHILEILVNLIKKMHLITISCHCKRNTNIRWIKMESVWVWVWVCEWVCFVLFYRMSWKRCCSKVKKWPNIPKEYTWSSFAYRM